MRWVEALLLGSVATSVAVIAVAVVGMLMLSGRIDRRRAGAVVAGCFLIFGASSIARGIAGTVSAAPAPDPEPIVRPPLAPPSPVVDGYDPYAGAAPAPRPVDKETLRRSQPREGK